MVTFNPILNPKKLLNLGGLEFGNEKKPTPTVTPTPTATPNMTMVPKPEDTPKVDTTTAPPDINYNVTTNKNAPITSENLKKPDANIKLPPAVPDTTNKEIISGITAESEKSALNKQIEADAAKAQTDKGTAVSGIEQLMQDVAGIKAKEGQYAEQAGAGALGKQIDDIQSSIDIETKSLQDKIDSLYQDPNLTMSMAGALASDAERKSASYMANLALTKSVLSKDYDRAVSYAKSKVEAEVAPLQAKLDAKKFVFEANKDVWNDAEKKKLEYQIAKETRDLDAQKKEKEALENNRIELLKMASSQNAPTSVINAITNAKTASEVVTAAGSYGVDRLDKALKEAELANKKASTAKIKAETGGTAGGKLVTVDGKSMIQNADGTLSNPKFANEVVTPEVAKKSVAQFEFLEKTAQEAIDLSSASGRSKGRQLLEKSIVGATDFTSLQNKTRTLQTNMLTLMTDPAVKKFFGPQMTENDVTMMAAGGTTLNPDDNTPEDYQAEAERILDMFKRAREAVQKGQTQDLIDTALPTLEIENNPATNEGYDLN